MYSSNTAFPRLFSFRRMVRLPHRKAIPCEESEEGYEKEAVAKMAGADVLLEW